MTERKLIENDATIDSFMLNEDSIAQKRQDLRIKLGMDAKKQKKDDRQLYEKLRMKLSKAGMEIEPVQFMKIILRLSVVLLTASTLIVGALLVVAQVRILQIILYLIIWSVLFFAFSYVLVHQIINIYLNYRTFKRQLAVEKALPEFLRLVASNYRSGLSLDEALIKSTRNRFGVLAREIEMVAKTTKVRGDLALSLEIFGKKFNSIILERAMNNISASIRSGANVSALLDEIANNITKMRNMRTSMAANVKNYVIFIIVAGIIIAPLMFSMSFQMNSTIDGLRGKIDQQTITSHSLNIKGAAQGVQPGHFDTFAILMIITNSIISGLVISMIKYGNFQQGIKNVPVFLIISLVLYFLGKSVLASVLTVI